MNSESQIIRTEYSDLMKKSYIDYAMSVIISRALPDVRDGLKPVQRRTLMICTNWESAMISRTENARVLSEIRWVNIILTATVRSTNLLLLWLRSLKKEWYL